MGPKPSQPQTGELFGYPLRDHLNLKHPLILLGDRIQWERIDALVADQFKSRTGRPATSPRLIAGLLYLQHAFDLSDEEVVATWVENPYWQVFTGEIYLQTRPPIDPSSLTRWRKRLGEAGVEEMLSLTLVLAQELGMLKESSFKTVIVDTTVMPKAIAHPTDSRLLERTRQHLVKAARACGLKLRQSYSRVAPQLARQVGRHAHARQFKRMRNVLGKLRKRVGRIWRDIDRQREQVTGPLRQWLDDLMARAERILTQQPKDKNKLYALHAQEVECISKGKARNPYEFGVKVSITTTHREGFVVGARLMPGRPYDGHTLYEALEQASIVGDCRIDTAVVDKGYRGADVPGVRILRSGQRRGVTRGIRAMIRRRSAIEPTIGHMKTDGKLDRNWLKGALGDALHAVLCGAGHNIRLLLRRLQCRLRRFCAFILLSILACVRLMLPDRSEMTL